MLPSCPWSWILHEACGKSRRCMDQFLPALKQRAWSKLYRLQHVEWGWTKDTLFWPLISYQQVDANRTAVPWLPLILRQPGCRSRIKLFTGELSSDRLRINLYRRLESELSFYKGDGCSILSSIQPEDIVGPGESSILHFGMAGVIASDIWAPFWS